MDGNELTQQLYQVARTVISRGTLGAERDVFYVTIGGWDMHNNIIEGMITQAGKVNSALEVFVNEMKAQGVWDDMVIQTNSDFARTLVFNGLGTDHSWGGNMFTFGGKVRGGIMHGQFPSLDLSHQNIVDTRRGSVIPSTPWEGVWSPIAKWFGVDASKLTEVMPNLNNFPTEIIPTKNEFFHEDA